MISEESSPDQLLGHISYITTWQECQILKSLGDICMTFWKIYRPSC